MAQTLRAPTASAVGVKRAPVAAAKPIVPIVAGTNANAMTLPALRAINPNTTPTVGQLWPRGGYQ